MRINGNGKVRVEFQPEKDLWKISAVRKASNPKNLEFINNQFKNDLVKNIKLNVRMTNPKRANIGFLRTAYLLAFGYMGYGF